MPGSVTGREFEDISEWLSQHSREVALVCQPDGTITSASASAEQVLGYTPDELCRKSLSDFMQPERVAAVRNLTPADETEGYRLEHETRHKTGRLLWLETVVEPVADEAGSVIRLFVLTRDITPRKRLAAQLQENQVRLRLINHISLKIVSGAPLTEIIQFVLEQLGSHFQKVRVTYSTLNEQSALEIVYSVQPPEQKPLTGMRFHLKRRLAFLNVQDMEQPFAVNDTAHDSRLGELGARLAALGIVSLLCVPVYPAGTVAGLLSFDAPEPRRWSALEVTILDEVAHYLSLAIYEDRVREEQRQAEESLRLAAERFRTALKNSPITVFNQDRDLRYTWVYNPVLGFTVEAAIGKQDQELLGDAAAVRRLIAVKQRVLETGEGTRSEVRLNMEGQEYWFDMTVEPLRDENGRVVGITCAVMDITWRKEMELKVLQLALEHERVRIITSFVQDASHEFRTPLSIIGSSLYLMEHADDQSRKHHHAEKAKEQINRIIRLLEDLTMMAALDSDPQLETHPVDLNNIVRDVYGRLQSHFQKAQVNVELALDETSPVMQADSERLHLALRKLVDNAIHHTPPGGKIILKTFLEREHLVIQVRDTGTGIEASAQQRIFERFFRLDSAHQTPGFGLGLPIAKKIIELHGGEITLASTPKQGSVFTIVLPL